MRNYRSEASRAVLPTGEQMNPLHPEDAYYFDRGQVALVLSKPERTRPTRVVTTFGSPEPLGSKVECYHDQTLAFMGTYTVVGYHVFATGETAGEVPNRKLPHSVYK